MELSSDTFTVWKSEIDSFEGMEFWLGGDMDETSHGRESSRLYKWLTAVNAVSYWR